MARRKASHGFTALRSAGAILPSSFLLEKVATQKAQRQEPHDYGLSKSFSMRDEIARCWNVGRDLFAIYEVQRHKAMHGTRGVGLRD